MRRNLIGREHIEILSNNYIGYLAYLDVASPYVVPITYHYDSATNSITSYSSEGHKIKAMRKNPAVAISVNEITSVADWQSVMVHGKFEELQGIDAKHMLHEARFISEFSAKIEAEGTPIVFRINIDEITGKLRQS